MPLDSVGIKTKPTKSTKKPYLSRSFSTLLYFDWCSSSISLFSISFSRSSSALRLLCHVVLSSIAALYCEGVSIRSLDTIPKGVSSFVLCRKSICHLFLSLVELVL